MNIIEAAEFKLGIQRKAWTDYMVYSDATAFWYWRAQMNWPIEKRIPTQLLQTDVFGSDYQVVDPATGTVMLTSDREVI